MSARPAFVEVPAARVLAIDGTGPPGGDEFQQAVAALFSVAYTAKFTAKKERGVAVKVPPLEGLYDANWAWTLLLRLPDELDDELVERARAEAAAKRALPAIAEVHVESLDEGPSAELLHVGPYSEEAPTIEQLHAYIRAAGRRPRGRHHEIYLGDPRRTKPERLRTMIRQPVTAGESR